MLRMVSRNMNFVLLIVGFSLLFCKNTKKASAYLESGLISFHYFCKEMVLKKKISGHISFLAVMAALMYAPSVKAEQEPDVAVRALLISASMDTVIVQPGETAPSGLTVPLVLVLEAEIESPESDRLIMFPQWTVSRTVTEDGKEETSQFLKRQESTTSYEFTEYGLFRIDFEWSYRDLDSTVTIPGKKVEPMTFSIDDSEIKVYNAFSPNGDGINDNYCIYMRSIVKADITIFNRWGQVLRKVSGSMDDILLQTSPQQESDGGYVLELWDGTYNGDMVNDGVYFINVQATGAGGRKYSEKSDINVLKGLGIR